MAPPLPNLRQHLLPWDRPLLPQAVAWLAGDWRGAGPLDLSDTLIVVPTNESGRRLREGLAAHAATRDQAVLAPRVTTPDGLVALPETHPAIASTLESQLAWIEVLRALEPDDFRDVFPIDPPARNFSWAGRLASQLLQRQKILAEDGLRFGDVGARAGADFPEAARWAQLAELEARYDAALAARGLRDAQAEKIAAAQAPAPPPGLARIVVLATPDPLPLARAVLAQLAATRPIDIVIFGPRGGGALFDAWGAVRPGEWEQRPLVLEDFAAHVHLCADAAEQAERIVAAAKNYGAPAGWLAVGLADAEIAAPLEHGLRAAGLAPFNPEGRSRRLDGFFALLAALATLVREADFAALAALARCPDFLSWLARRPAAKKCSAADLLATLDQLHEQHLPATLAAARRHAEKERFAAARAALAAAAELHAALTDGAFPANATTALAQLFGEQIVANDSALAEAGGAWMEILREAARAAEKFPGVNAAEWWELALAEFAGQRRAGEKPAGAIELLGWLELLWEDAPHLIVAGLNDGRVPEAIVGDAFLPEGLRARLGLKTNAARFARDAYLLDALAASRTAAGRLDIVLGKVSAAGDPLRPSRLLLRCADAVLPERVRFLFRAVESARANPAWRRAWRLTPTPDAAIPRIAVTAFQDYLTCPFRFYLRHGLGVEPIDPAKTELNAMDFGTLVHAALEKLGHESALRDCAEPDTLRKFLLAEFEHVARARFGAELTLPLVIQFESARQRLARAAEVLAEQRAAGWVVERVEWKFPEAYAIGGLVVRGKIDRIERHATTGRVRVLDFKTSDRAVAPREAHCRRARAEESAWPAARFTIEGTEWVWTNLQLPLYLEAVAAEFGANVECGYFNLPKATGETAVTEWTDFSGEWRAAAQRGAEAIAAAVVAREFWPPTEIDPRHEDERFAGFFHQGTAASVEWRSAGVPPAKTSEAGETPALR